MHKKRYVLIFARAINGNETFAGLLAGFGS